MWPVITDATLSLLRRRAYQMFFAALVLDFVASVGWSLSGVASEAAYGTWPDILFLFYYPLAASGCVLLYFDLGGRLSTARSVFDVATLSVGIGTLVWFSALQPWASMSSAEIGVHWSTVGYGVGCTLALIAGAMVAMQITDWRSQLPLAWLLTATGALMLADLLWVKDQLRGTHIVGSASINCAYYLFYICLAMCARAECGPRRAPVDTRGLNGDLRGSLPMVALSAGIIALLDDLFALTNYQSPLLIAVMVGATVLVIASQVLATREMVGLHRQVAARRFDERLTELVRRSSDMIAICGKDGVFRYASPSSEQLLGTAPAELIGKRLDEVLGPQAGQVREVFEAVAQAAQSEQPAFFAVPQANGETRSFKMVIANLCHVESIGGITLNIRDVSDAHRLNEQLRALAFHDPLTLLANRSLFSDRVHQAIRHVGEGMTPAVLFIDMDNFKKVNDSMGHGAGDQLLRGFAQRLVQSTRVGDTVARLGGDEFAVLIDHAPNSDAAMAVARQVIEACRQPFEIEGQPVRVGASIGVAIADRTSNVERLMRNADAAMYAAKSRGKGHAELFQPEMLRAARRRLSIENELAVAIEQRQFEAHYQPIVDLATRHLVGVEALMRWRHPARGIVMPGEFIPLAEETGQIVPMTQWMIDRASADLARLQREIAQGEGLRMSVNVSSRYLGQGDCVADVRAALRAHRIAPACLILEVTESLLLDDSTNIEKTFNQLKALGVRLALDDFGTGYSSLAYLHRFPIDILKIDRSFVERLSRGPEDADGVDAVALARAILSLADALGLDTVAEGIEADGQRNTLLGIGCKTGQGYSFGKAMPIDEIFDAAVTRRREVFSSNISGPVDFTATGRFRGI
jgi:diguanylate cyclase (GGDEF)-like protein/PAS domain S-box-containing protein